MDFYKGTVVENSLSDKSILAQLEILKTHQSGHWILHDVSVRTDQLSDLAKSLADGPWYVHLWQPGSDDVVVLFKNRTFNIKHSDRATWTDAVAYGKSIGIPEEQLDFVIR